MKLFYTSLKLQEYLKGNEMEKKIWQSNLTKNPRDANDYYIERVDAIIENAVYRRASDIHLEPFSVDRMRIRYRIDGKLCVVEEEPYQFFDRLITRIKILSKLNITESRLPQDGAFQHCFGEKRIDIRVSTMPTEYGENLVLRLLGCMDGLNTLSGIGMLGEDQQRLQRMLTHQSGLILFNGMTGSGKTTTLYAVMSQLNDSGVHMLSIEDPVEMNIPGVTQIPVNPEIGLTIHEVLKSVLRQDPDIICVGEIRDDAVAMTAVRAALTGHLVLATLHTMDAWSSRERLLDMGVPEYLIRAVLRGAVSQRLLRRLCPHCKEAYLASEKECRYLKGKGPLSLYRAKGCACCGGSGYLGRIGIFELLVIDPSFWKIGEDCQGGVPGGQGILRKAARSLIIQGVTSLEEGVRCIAG